MNRRYPHGHRYPAPTPVPGRWPPAPSPLGASFTDRVMARVAQEPRPTPTRALLHSLRHLALRDALAALMTAWRIAFEPARPVPAGTRARSAALLLGVVMLFGVGTPLVLSGALALLGRDGPTPAQLDMGASPSASPAILQPTPSPSPTPRPTLGPTPAPQAARTPVPRTEAATARPRQTAEAEDERRSSGDRAKARRETPEPKERDDDDERRDRAED